MSDIYVLNSKVEENHTASSFKSGLLRIYATPAMIALMEQACLEMVYDILAENEATVGGAVSIKHLAPTPVGMKVRAEARLIEKDGKKLTFYVEAFDELGKIGEGEHIRFIVDANKFQGKTDNKLNELNG